MTTLDENALNLLFLNARTHHGWQDRPVDSALLQRLYDVAKMGPTSANTQPMRIVFVQSAVGKQRLKPALAAGNVAQTMAAPVTAIIAQQVAFHDHMPMLFPAVPAMHGILAGLPDAVRERMGYQGSSMQGAYVILAARALGLDCGPMAGFDNAKVDAEFFADGACKSNFLLNLGYGDAANLYPRGPRFDFAQACRIE